jgi:putative ABC transport system substrate-binding protein
VLSGAADPVATGFVKSLPRPGGNVTGFSLQIFELFAKQLEVLKQAVPKLQQVGVLVPPGVSSASSTAIDGAARLLRLKIQYATVASAAELPEAFSAMSRARAGAVMVTPGPGGPLDKEVKQLVALPAKHRLPTMYTWRYFVEAGGLMAYAVDLIDIYRQSARFVDKILKGTKPADIPVEQPSKFEFVINLKTARALGLAIPQPVLQRADRLIE